MRFGLQCLYPAHLYHLSGPVVVACGLAGAIVLFAKRGRKALPPPGHGTNLIMLVGFAVYVLFFGLFSHLQSARLYALTLPFVVYASSYFLLWAFRALPRVGTAAVTVTCALLLISMGWLSGRYLSAHSGLKAASDLIVQRIRTGELVKANAAAQVAYGAAISESLAGRRLLVISFFTRDEEETHRQYPPVAMLQDGIDIVTAVSVLEKYDALAEGTPEQVRLMIQEFAKGLTAHEVIPVGADTFSATPYYYLEDVYSWRSYRYIKELLRTARDSIFVYVPKVAEP